MTYSIQFNEDLVLVVKMSWSWCCNLQSC